jgi:ferredoxin
MTKSNVNQDQQRVVVDASRCQAYGVCVAVNPELFDIPDGALVAHVLRDGLSDEDRRDVEDAIDGCPARAISLKSQVH